MSRRVRRPMRAMVAAAVVAATLAVPGGPVAVAPAGADEDCPLARTGRSLVRYDDGVDAAARLRAAGAGRIEPLGPGLAAAELGRRGAPGARRVTPELVRPFATASNDELRSLQWALDVQHADQAANHSDGTGVIVAVLDSGVDGTHPELAGRVLAGADVTRAPTQPLPEGSSSDSVGHGTFVAGVVAALRNNGTGIAGIAPAARILPVKVGDDEGVTSAAFIRGLRFAVDNGARVVNMSFGGCGREQAEQEAIDRAVAAGVVMVASSGNLDPSFARSQPSVYPAAYDHVIAVGATTRDERLAGYSVTGPFVDVVAPGGAGGGGAQQDLVGLTRPSPEDGCTSACYAVFAGTSFSAPHVSAVAALVLAANPNYTAHQVHDVLAATSIDLGPPGRDDEFGAGRVDAAGAAALARQSRTVERIAGDDRFVTAARLSARSFPGQAELAYLARGDTFSPDALAAGPAAVARAGPVLLTRQCSLPDVTVAELERLAVTTVVVLGGREAVCDQVLARLSGLPTGPTVRRVNGTDRYDTAARLAAETFGPAAATAYLARGDAFSPDALAGGTVAGTAKAPILLTEQCSLPSATSSALDALSVTSVVILGGPAAVCDQVAGQLAGAGRQVSRLSGSDRYSTAVVVAGSAFPDPTSGVMLARGDTFSPDALTAAPAAVRLGMPLLLTSQCFAPPASAMFVNARDTRRVLVAGGASAVCEAVLVRFL